MSSAEDDRGYARRGTFRRIERSSERSCLLITERGLFSLRPLHRTVIADSSPYDLGAGVSWSQVNEPRPFAVDALAHAIPFRTRDGGTITGDEKILWARLAVDGARRKSIDAIGRQRGLVEARLRLREIAEVLRGEMQGISRDPIKRVEIALRTTLCIDHLRLAQSHDMDDKRKASIAKLGERLENRFATPQGIRKWLAEISTFVTGKAGAYSSVQARAFVLYILKWWVSNTGKIPAINRPQSSNNSNVICKTNFYCFLDAAWQDADMRTGNALDGMGDPTIDRLVRTIMIEVANDPVIIAIREKRKSLK